jgi:hypothetical protein
LQTLLQIGPGSPSLAAQVCERRGGAAPNMVVGVLLQQLHQRRHDLVAVVRELSQVNDGHASLFDVGFLQGREIPFDDVVRVD